MTRRSSDGSFIISAGEVGSYSVCPEAWRLQAIQGVRPSSSDGLSAQGTKLHDDWAASFSEAVYLQHAIRLVLLLIMLTVLIVLLRT